MFQNQQNSARGGPLGGSRLQNGKLGEPARMSTTGPWLTALLVLGNGSQWAFGGPMGAAPGLPNAQSRANGSGLSSFAQTIGGSQSHTPLNLE
jgi:CCR4-NOT transcription complex subunit 2